MKILALLLGLVLTGCSTVNHISTAPQVLTYTSDPNAEKLVPPCACLPAIAYSKTVTGPLFSWDLDKQTWK